MKSFSKRKIKSKKQEKMEKEKELPHVFKLRVDVNMKTFNCDLCSMYTLQISVKNNV